MRRTVFAVLALVGAMSDAPFAHDREQSDSIGSFRQIATFNVPGATSAEIVAASRDGRRLVYSDAIGRKFGLVDITNPRLPHQIATLDAGGDPTSVAVLPVGNFAIGCVQPGRLVLIDLTTFAIVGTRAIGAGPDSVAVTRIGGEVVAAIAIENEGALGKGYVEVVRIDLANFAASPGAIVTFDDEAALAAAGLLAVDDPQPEFVSIRGRKVAVTLQENNGIAIIDIGNPAAPTLERLFAAGMVEDRPADLASDSRISFTDVYPRDVLVSTPTAGARIPDAIAWTADGEWLFTADEGEEDFEGGRGWSVRTAWGMSTRDDGGSLEALAVQFGHYPEGRSDAKGIEAEGLVISRFGGRQFLFVSSERGAFVAVYRLDSRNRPRFVQLLSTGQGPEGLLAIPSRNLFVTANEGDDQDGSISIFEAVGGDWEPPRTQPTILSRSVEEPWGALSGLAASTGNKDVLFAVPDNALPSAIFTIHTGGGFAGIGERSAVTRAGAQVLYDLEGITIDDSIERPHRKPGFWLASEGDGATTKNVLVQVDANGEVLREIFLPADVDAPGVRITSNGFEGVAVSSDGRYLLVAVQRPFRGDQAVGGVTYTRIARYDLERERWETFFYPLVTGPSGVTIGLSEIAVVGRTRHGHDVFAVIERDNQLAGNATVKRIYTFTLDGIAPVDIATAVNAGTIIGSAVSKTLLRDLLPLFTPYEKIEGLTRARDGGLWVVLDNDGGEFESRLIRLEHATRR